jgi:hypothetical protein
MSTAEIKRHWTRVAALGCCISHSPGPTLHHVHGGSCRFVGIHKGMGQKTSDWLVIPLAAQYHCAGPQAIDGGGITVREWEELFGTQVEFLEWVSRRLGVDVFQKAGLEYRVNFK